jgi:hypothetical protein
LAWFQAVVPQQQRRVAIADRPIADAGKPGDTVKFGR